jgi:3-oxoadipate enol-lactonase / 4-carboxymuconolactone decarboxylase
MRDASAVHFELVGEGFPLFLLPGAAVDGSAWRAAGYVDELSSEFLCVIVDPPGMGRSKRPRARTACHAGNIAANVVAIADELGFERFAIWGASAGGAAGIVVAVEHPERVVALIVSGWWTPFDPEQERASFERGAALTRADGVQAVIGAGCDAEGMAAEHWVRRLDADREVVARIREGLLAYDWKALAEPEQITVPTLLIVGEQEDEDGEVPAAAARIPHGEAVVIPGRGHIGAWLDAQPESTRSARHFLARLVSPDHVTTGSQTSH